MSVITDVVLLASLSEDELDAYITEFNNRGVGKFSRIDKFTLPSERCIQATIYIGAFDVFRINAVELKRFLDSIAWQYPKDVQVLVKEEHEDTFTLFVPSAKTETTRKPELVTSPNTFAQEMADVANEIKDDPETAHLTMDMIMTRVLRELGYDEGIDIFDLIDKNYC